MELPSAAAPTELGTRKIGTLLRQYAVVWLVTKDGGAAGGFPEKCRAAEAVGAKLVVLRRPEERGESMETIAAECEEMLKWK